MSVRSRGYAVPSQPACGSSPADQAGIRSHGPGCTSSRGNIPVLPRGAQHRARRWGAVGEAIVGVVANPLSGRDIRRLTTRASVFPTAEKANMIQRMLTAFGAVGVHRVLLSTDLGGISAAVFRALERHRAQTGPGGQRRPGHDARWPEVDLLDGQPIRQTARDTVDAVRRMVTAGTRVIVCLGGDGTARVAASAAGDVPMLALSTGTNNVFPAVREATVAGLAAGLVAIGAVPAGQATTRAKLLEVRVGNRTETALVDVAVSTER